MLMYTVLYTVYSVHCALYSGKEMEMNQKTSALSEGKRSVMLNSSVVITVVK